jgi:hypothetical protein
VSTQQTDGKKSGARSLWIWVVLAFVLLISAWGGLILIANQHHPDLIEAQDH